MSDSVTVTSGQSWFSRIGQSIKSVLVGLVLFVVAFPVLFWNEGRAVQTAKSLDEGAGAVVSVPADAVDPGKEGTLVHVSGPVSTEGELVDPELGVHAQGVKLIRRVEMYQWKEVEKSEKKKKLGGGEETVTTYTYEKAWSDDEIDSAAFQKTDGHQNPGSFPIQANTEVADPVHVGAFTLSADQVDQISEGKPLPVTEAMLAEIPSGRGADWQIGEGRFYLGQNSSSPQIGDVRVSFELVNPATVSLVGVQTGDTFAAYQAKAGDAILLVEEGTHTAEAMFQAAHSANTVLTWIMRAGGFLMMFIGLIAIFKPISVFADVVPLFGTMLGAGLGVFSFLLAFVLSVLTIAIAWIFYRPLLGVLLLALALGGLFWLVSLGRKKKRQRMALPIPPPPPAPMPA